MFDKSYEARFISTNTDAIGVTFDLWHFSSAKTGKPYIIIVEKYGLDVYAVKFHLRQHKGNPNKYSMLTADGEAGVIIMTVMKVMLYYAHTYPSSSFVVIGSGNIGEGNENTKRFKLYSRIIRLFVSEDKFVHYENEEHSAYLLMRRGCRDVSPEMIIDYIDTNR